MSKRFFQCITVLMVCVSMFAALAAGSFAAETPAGQEQIENSVNSYHVTVYFTGNEGLALKSAPSLDSATFLRIPEGTELYISQTSGYWGFISYSGYNGWVYLKYTRIRGDYPTIQPVSGFVAPVYYTVYDTDGEGLELRKTASADDSTFGPLMDGTVVKVEAVSGEWVYVENNGHYGWCNTYFLRNSTQDEIAAYEQMQAAKKESEQAAAGVNTQNSGQAAAGLNTQDPGQAVTGLNAQISPSISEDSQGLAISTCIAEYNGKAYIIGGYGTQLEVLPVTPAKYMYICSFAFYNDKVYYCCKDGGTSDYNMALFESNLDGTGQKELYDPGIVSGSLNDFALKDGFLYFRETYWANSQLMETWYRIDLATYTISSTQDIPDDVRAAVSQSNGYYVKGDLKFYSLNDSVIVMENADGTTEILAQPGRTFRLEGVISADTADDLYLYYSTFVGGDAYLYRIKLSTRETEYVDSHMAVGGGIYFNW